MKLNCHIRIGWPYEVGIDYGNGDVREVEPKATNKVPLDGGHGNLHLPDFSVQAIDSHFH